MPSKRRRSEAKTPKKSVTRPPALRIQTTPSPATIVRGKAIHIPATKSQQQPTTPPPNTSGNTSPPSKRIYRETSVSKVLGNSVWPRFHPRKNYLEQCRRASSAPLPDTQATLPAPLTRVTSWITPWGTVVQTNSEQIQHRSALAPRKTWIEGNLEWRRTLG